MRPVCSKAIAACFALMRWMDATEAMLVNYTSRLGLALLCTSNSHISATSIGVGESSEHQELSVSRLSERLTKLGGQARPSLVGLLLCRQSSASSRHAQGVVQHNKHLIFYLCNLVVVAYHARREQSMKLFPIRKSAYINSFCEC